MTDKAARAAGLEVVRRHPLIGAEVRGVDLSKPLTEARRAALNALWLEHLLLIFPDSPIDDAAHIAFGRRFGDLELHPSLAHRGSAHPEIYRVSNVDEAGQLIPPDDSGWRYLSQSWRWHTDSSFRAVPSKGSILHGIEITNAGGDTFFANMVAAHDSLPPAMQARIADLWVIHDHDFILRQSPQPATRPDKDRYESLPPVRHPLVRRHPETGHRSLFLSPHTMSGVVGMEENAGRALLDELVAHATADRFVYRHVWSPHDVIMWDNRCTMHSVAPFDNARIRRIMHRVTLVGEEAPIPAT